MANAAQAAGDDMADPGVRADKGEALIAPTDFSIAQHHDPVRFFASCLELSRVESLQNIRHQSIPAPSNAGDLTSFIYFFAKMRARPETALIIKVTPEQQTVTSSGGGAMPHCDHSW